CEVRLNPSRSSVPEYRLRGRSQFAGEQIRCPCNQKDSTDCRIQQVNSVHLLYHRWSDSATGSRPHPYLNSTASQRAGCLLIFVRLCVNPPFTHATLPILCGNTAAGLPSTSFRSSQSASAITR